MAFALERLLVPALFGLGIGLLLHRDVVRGNELSASLASFEAARIEALGASQAREVLLDHARRQVLQLRAEQAASLVALGAVHDLRNLLLPVAMAAHLLAEEPELPHEVVPQLAAPVVRGAALCNRILEAETGPPPDFVPDAGGEPRDGEIHGFGLRLVHAMATRNGGRFWLENANRGAVAVLELPLAPG